MIDYTMVNMKLEDNDTLEYLELVAILAVIAFFTYNRYLNRNFYSNYDKFNVTPDDFAIVLKNVPKNFAPDIDEALIEIVNEEFKKLIEIK